MRRIPALVLLFSVVAPCVSAAENGPIHHRITARIIPADHRIDVVDRITFGETVATDDGGGYRFLLHAGLQPQVEGPGWALESLAGDAAPSFAGINASSGKTDDDIPLESWRLVPADAAAQPVELRYGGTIHHPIEISGEEYQRNFSETPGIIDERGVFLAGASYWVPTFGDQMLSFELEVTGLVPPWDLVSQGRRIRHELDADGSRTTAWRLEHPSPEVYLVAGPWHEFQEQAGEVEIFAFLRDDDASLAGKYLAATKRYLKLYQGMLPKFPYASFALVENFWETGYGMPGFTLLGPRIIRFPWILTSSYPHELLHNWWGNSAYVDLDRGDWCEGLTAYMADHLFAEQRGEGATYRRVALKKYTDFVSAGEDFPLIDFTSRRSAATEAVGYGKSLMVFHMLRRAVGDENFVAALSRFFEDQRFSRASFDEIAAAIETVAGGDWRPFFAEWTGRSGAPKLEIRDLELSERDDSDRPWRLRIRLEQSQSEEAFPLTVPVAVTIEGQEEVLWVEAGSCHRFCTVDVACPGRPLRVDVDPLFDVMRRLDPLEVPPALSTLFGSDDPLFILPAAASVDELTAWRELAAAWARPAEPRIVMDDEIDALPLETAWVMGWSNRHGDAVARRLAEHGVARGTDGIDLASQSVPRADHSVVLVARGNEDPGSALGWVAAHPPEAVPGLARKLPHYNRYSYLAFRGPEPDNMIKGMWQPISSPLVRNLSGGELPELRLPARAALAELPPVFDVESLRTIVGELADEALQGRGLGSVGLEEASALVESRFAELGLASAVGTGYRQTWSWTGGHPEREMTLTNLVARIAGTDPALAEQPVVVIAHLDHLGRGWPDVRAGNEGKIHPGADDNASGVAVLLELARVMSSEAKRPRPVIFAVVTGEEAGRVGSKKLIRGLTESGAPFACVNIDSVGRLSGGKLFVLNTDSAREWRFIFMGVGYTTGAPVSVVAEPLDSSDQMSCIESGVPAVQLFTGPHADYHRPTDTADAIDAEGMAVVTEAVHEAVAYLAERSEALTVTIGPTEPAATRPSEEAPRRASLGTMPDFGFEGPGVRVHRVMPGSAAESAGIRAGDVVVALGEQNVEDLRGYSRLLKGHAPGDEILVTVVREGAELSFEAVLGAR